MADATPLTPEQKLQHYAATQYPKTLTRVNDRVYHLLGYAHSSVTAIIGDTSVIIVDATDSPGYAEGVKTEIATLTDKPITTLIYTHGHPDHRGGASAFRDTLTEIIAVAPKKKPLGNAARLNDIMGKRGAYQFGVGLTDEELITQGLGIREGHTIGLGAYDPVPPTTVYTESVEREIDGVKMVIVPAPGETDDTLFVWLPDDDALCCGDNYYACWPNLYAIRGTQYRDVFDWVASLDAIMSYQPNALLPGHTLPLIGRELVQERLQVYRDAIAYVLDRTLECMNAGMTLPQVAEAVVLPEEYASQEFLGEYYGLVQWAVKNIYVGYLGWFDGNPANMMPLPEDEWASTLRELIGQDKLDAKIQECLAAEEFQKALQLLELTDRPAWKREALLGRARQTTSSNARHFLMKAAQEL